MRVNKRSKIEVKNSKMPIVNATKKQLKGKHREPVLAYGDVSQDPSPPPSPTRISSYPSPAKETLTLVSEAEQLVKLEAEMAWLKDQFLKNAKRENKESASKGGNDLASLLV
jgi:hypothetical protein